MTGNCKKKRKASRRKARQLAILKKVAELKKRMFFDPCDDSCQESKNCPF